MDTTATSNDKDSVNADQPDKLMVSGLVCLQKREGLPAEVKRGMIIRTREGREAGKVAAVIVDNEHQQVTHVVLGRTVQTPDYRLVPVDLIEQVDGETVSLGIFDQVVESLPKRQAS